MNWTLYGVEVIFFATLGFTFIAALVGRKHSRISKAGLSNQHLNKWLIGLSAGATANSGFIVTGAVGLGYVFGPQWLFLPISWFLGDLIFWKLFPARINSIGRKYNVTTLSELLKSGLSGRYSKAASVITTLLIVIFLGGYTSAQWFAGQKFVSGAFELSSTSSLMLFACIIVAYTSIGGFRGSVYADAVQAIIRIIGTILALVTVIYFASTQQQFILTSWPITSENFSYWLPGNTVTTFLFFILGYACSALGFGLGQPQIISRYLAGSSPDETKAAQWIYIGFVQLTWLSMTLFGVILKGVMPEISDPEAGLSIFFKAHYGNIITGIIVADIFSTIAATSNSLLVAMAQAIIHDFFPNYLKLKLKIPLNIIVICVLGFLTMAATLLLPKDSTVFILAIGSVSLMGAVLAAPMIIKLLGYQRTGASLLISIIASLMSAMIWKFSGMDIILNEAVIGILVGLLTNWLVVKQFGRFSLK